MTNKTFTFTDLVRHPDETCRRAREAGAVVSTEVGPLVAQSEGVRAMLREPRLRADLRTHLERSGITSGAFYESMRHSPLNLDGEGHKRWRQLAVRAFTPQSVERLRPFLRTTCTRLISEFRVPGRAEFIAEFAKQLSSLALCALIGVPPEDRERFSGWAEAIGAGLNGVLAASRIAGVDRAVVELTEYCEALLAKRRRAPCDDLVSRIALADGVDPSLAVAVVGGLVFAGLDTTKYQLGWMIAVLSQYPSEWERVAREPSRAQDVVEEVLRFRSSSALVSRRAAEPLELFGTAVPAGALLIASLWSANRDPRVFAKPDAFDPEANCGEPHLAFGSGPHYCLGAALARAELQEALIALSARITCPRLQAGVAFTPPMGVTGPTVLPIAFAAR